MMRSATSGSTNAELAVQNILTIAVGSGALGDAISSFGDQRVWNRADACLTTRRSELMREPVSASFANSTKVVVRHVRVRVDLLVLESVWLSISGVSGATFSL